jgi:hypothetical protein
MCGYPFTSISRYSPDLGTKPPVTAKENDQELLTNDTTDDCAIIVGLDRKSVV